MRRGFTLIELMVVLAVVGVITAMLLPAVQQARESARRIECANRLRQISIATLTREAAFRDLPYAFMNEHPLSPTYARDFGYFSRLLTQLEVPVELDNRGNVFASVNSPLLLSRVPVLECPSSFLPRTLGPYSQDFLAAKPIINLHLAVSDFAFSGGYLDKPIGFGIAKFYDGIGVLSLRQDRGVRLADILDGTSNTLMIWENASGAIVQKNLESTQISQIVSGNSNMIFVSRDKNFVEITAPEAFRSYVHSWAGFRVGYLSMDNPVQVNLTNSLGRPFSFHQTGSNASCCDGSVKFISSMTDSLVLCNTVSIQQSDSPVLND